MNTVQFAQIAVLSRNPNYQSWISWFNLLWKLHVVGICRRNLHYAEFFATISRMTASSTTRSFLPSSTMSLMHDQGSCEIVIFDQSKEVIIKIYYTLKQIKMSEKTTICTTCGTELPDAPGCIKCPVCGTKSCGE